MKISLDGFFMTHPVSAELITTIWPENLTPFEKWENTDTDRYFVVNRPDIAEWLSKNANCFDDRYPMLLHLQRRGHFLGEQIWFSFRDCENDNYPIYDNMKYPDVDGLTWEELGKAHDKYYDYAWTEEGRKHLIRYINLDDADPDNPVESYETVITEPKPEEALALLQFAFPDITLKELQDCLYDCCGLDLR